MIICISWDSSQSPSTYFFELEKLSSLIFLAQQNQSNGNVAKYFSVVSRAYVKGYLEFINSEYPAGYMP